MFVEDESDPRAQRVRYLMTDVAGVAVEHHRRVTGSTWRLSGVDSLARHDQLQLFPQVGEGVKHDVEFCEAVVAHICVDLNVVTTVGNVAVTRVPSVRSSSASHCNCPRS